ncbi:MAG: hypothetical protein ACFFCV_10235 [Promethearchaeota archaeon]
MEVPITEKFTLINGKIKKTLLNDYKNNTFLEISENFNAIPIEKIIGFLQEQSEKYNDLLKSKKLLKFIYQYRKSVSFNIEVSSKYNEIIQNLIFLLKNHMFIKKKENLYKELELAERLRKSSDITASTDLLKKLNESLTNNKNKLKFLEQDYFQQKNQIGQLRKKINGLNSKIQELTRQKKQYFSQINRITREMTSNIQEPKEDSNNNVVDTGIKLTNAEKIKNLQKKAKETQVEINKITSKKSQTQLKLEEKAPIFDTYEKDYQSLLDMIKTEEKRINDLQSDLKNKFNDEENQGNQDVDLSNFKPIRSSYSIGEELEKIDNELKKIIIPKEFGDPKNLNNLSLIITKLRDFEEKIRIHESEIMITINETEIYECFEQFRKLENHFDDVENLINKFLSVINIQAQFGIIVDDNNQNFFIEIKFLKNEKENVNYDELTTPEKIFFIIAFYLSIELHIKKEYIIFSNASLLSKYNKAGSIYRTIRKILPIFEMDDSFSSFKLIFIISNLELKKEIKNLKVNLIQES